MLFFVLFVTLGLKGQLDTKTASQLKAIKIPYNPLAVLLKGRAGLQLAVAPIADRPLLGHGSKAYEPRYLRNFREIRDIREMRRAKQLRFHSVILESWVFGGVMGAVFWCYVFYCMAALLRQSLSTGDSSTVLLCSILFCSGAFGILCSPMGYARFDWPPLWQLPWCLLLVCLSIVASGGVSVAYEFSVIEELVQKPLDCAVVYVGRDTQLKSL